MIDQLFKLVFGNIVILRRIFNYVKLYKKNKIVACGYRNEILEHKEREYISKLVYIGSEMLNKGDFPTGFVLKEIVFHYSELSVIKGDVIPYGVEILEFSRWNIGNRTTPFSKLPSTIHTVKNVSIFKNKGTDEGDGIYDINEYYIIPPNITSLSFTEQCLNISNNNERGDGFTTIPNTIKELKFDKNWNNQGIKLRKGDIPEGVINLSMIGYKVKHLTIGILPNSIKELEITYSKGSFDFMPPNVESLILLCNGDLTPESNFNSYSSIKKLIIRLINPYSEVKQNSLPSNITDLIIDGIQHNIKINTIPNSVLNLDLWFSGKFENNDYISKGAIPNSVSSFTSHKIITEPNILPPSLTNLIIRQTFSEEIYHTDLGKDLSKMISILPQSLTSIKLPNYFEDFNNIFPSTINKIEYGY